MSTTLNEAKPCPSCGKPLPTGALAGLCPACLLAQGAETDAGEPVASAHFRAPPLEEVATLFPHLEILSLLGAAGMGAVYQARQPALDRMVALKILPAATASGVNFAERFNREARALARLSHPNIVAVFEFGQAGGLHFFIMEFVDGANLRQLEQAGRLSPREALQIIPQICDALQYAHDEGVVHRDIKPENVLVDRKGRVKIADFGLAKILGVEAESLRLTAEGQVMGTPHYMAPEQVERPLTVDHRADIYALGVVFYEMLTGDLPIGKFSPPSRKVQVDVRLDEVVLRALENDPARRYQQASEVKSGIETIAGTPATAVATAVPEVEKNHLRWAGFPLAVELAGARRIHWKGTLKAFAILFGVLTVAFGIVSLITGRSLLGWVGIVGGTSVVMRLLIAAVLVAWGVARALRSPPATRPWPQTPQGTVILPPTQFSRKAVVGACWAPFFFIAALLYFILEEVTTDATGLPARSKEWWQILLSVTALPLGLAAPFGTTILGWLAVGNIRRARGRLGGLALAVFDAQFFPLLALDGLLVWIWVTMVNGLQGQAVLEPFHSGEVSALTKAGAAAICVLVDLWIIRRVWRAVRLEGGAVLDPWWSSNRGAIAIGLACALVIVAVGQRRTNLPGIFKRGPQQVAVKDTTTGALVAHLPNGGTMELLALADAGAAPNEWWRPDGGLLAPATFEIKTPGSLNVPDALARDLIFRFVNLPEGAPFPIMECNPGSGHSSGNGVRRNGQLLEDAWPFRMAWPERIPSVTIRLGVSLVPWHTVVTSDQINHSLESTHLHGDPDVQVNFHQVGERDGETLVTVVRGHDDGKWQTRIVALDTNGVEHGEASGKGTPSEKNETWTYTFRVPLAAVREFRAQIRPLYWVEFRDVALSGQGLARRTGVPPPAGILVAAHDPAKGRLAARLQPRGTVELLAVSDEGAAPNAWWTPQGEAAPETLYEIIHPDRQGPADRVNRNLLLRQRDLPGGASSLMSEIVDGGGGSGGREVLRDGKSLPGGWLLSGSFAPGATRGTVRLGFGLVPWQTVSVHNADGNRSSREVVPDVPDLPVQLHQISEAGGEAQVTLLVGYPSREWESRVVAVDARGEEHTSVTAHGSGMPQDSLSVWSYKFFRLPLAQVKDFRVQVRPVQWVEFRDIPLHPRDRRALGRSSRALVPTALGPEREAHVTELFDFDKGLGGEFPTAADGTKNYRGIERNPSWMRERKFDVDAGTNVLHALQMQIVDLKNTDWETLTVPQLEERLRVFYGPTRLPSIPNATLPVTFGFRTADGAMGLLQITGFDEGKAGVHLRYRLIERAHFESP